MTLGVTIATSLLLGTSAAHADGWKKCAANPSACPYFFDVYPRDKAFRTAFNGALQRAGIRRPAWLSNTTASPAELLRGPDSHRFLLNACQPHNCGGHFFIVIYDPQQADARGLQVLDDRQTFFGELSDEEKKLLRSKLQ